MKQSAVYNITDFTYDKANRAFSYLEINHENVPLAGSDVQSSKTVSVNTSGDINVLPSTGYQSMAKVVIEADIKLYAFKSAADAVAYLKVSATPGDTGKALLTTDAGLTEVDYTKSSDTVIEIDISDVPTSFTRFLGGDIEL